MMRFERSRLVVRSLKLNAREVGLIAIKNHTIIIGR